MARLGRWLDFNRPILVFCAALMAALGTDLVAGQRSALRYAIEIPAVLALLAIFVWRLGHLRDGDDDAETDAPSRHYREPGSNAKVVRREKE